MTPAVPAAKPDRFASLDMFRGATIVLMIVVNTGGAGARFAQLMHAPWIGFTLADLVYPSFQFAVGNAMGFAFRRPTTDAVFLGRIFRRATIIVLLGVLMYWYPFVSHGEDGWAVKPFADTRLTGVLQRIALCYLIAGLLARYLTPRLLVAAAVALVAAHWAILIAFGPPGAAFARDGNAAALLDLRVIGLAHLYRWDHGFDPEGLLGTLPATANVIAGYLAALVVQRWGKHKTTMRRLMLAGAALVAIALALAPVLPITKMLWTGSFVALTVGLDLILLGGTIALVEIRGLHRGLGLLQMLGRNPLAVYLFSELLVVTLEMVHAEPDVGLYAWIGIHVFQALAPGPVGSLLCALAYTAICCLFGWLLDRRGIILKV